MTDSSSLRALAEHYRVATGYDDWAARPVMVDDEVVAAVLAALGVDVSDPDAALARALAEVPLLPPTVVADVGVPSSVALTGEATSATVELEDTSVRVLAVAGRELLLPGDLPIGWHRLVVATADGVRTAATLIVPPATLPEVARGWGWAAQLYQLRSRDSWGVGDLADLRLLTSWSGGEGAALVLVNPMHAGPPVLPLDPSPYSPSSRRFRAPQYLRPELTAEYLAAPPDVRAEVDALARSTHAANTARAHRPRRELDGQGAGAGRAVRPAGDARPLGPARRLRRGDAPACASSPRTTRWPRCTACASPTGRPSCTTRGRRR